MKNEEKLLDICAEVLFVDRDTLVIDEERDDLDSLAILQIAAEMENVFDCVISEDKLKGFKIRKIADFLKLLDK